MVSRYLTIKLISHKPLLRRNLTFAAVSLQHGGSSGITHSFPWLFPTGGYVPVYDYPVCRFPLNHSPEGSFMSFSLDLHA